MASCLHCLFYSEGVSQSPLMSLILNYESAKEAFLPISAWTMNLNMASSGNTDQGHQHGLW